jgi:hypothetical protein
MKKLLVAFAVAGLVGTANAQSAFEGFYGQVGVGYESISTNATAGRSRDGVAYTTSYSDANSLNASVGIGNYFSITPTFLLGIGAEYSPLAGSKANNTTNAAGDISTGKSWKKDSYSVFLSPAYAIDKSSLAYAKLGYTGLTIKDQPTSGASTNTNYKGYMLGLGYRQVVQGGLYGFIETNYAQYGSKTDSDGATGSTKPKSMNVMLGVGYKF